MVEMHNDQIEAQLLALIGERQKDIERIRSLDRTDREALEVVKADVVARTFNEALALGAPSGADSKLK